MLSALRFVIGAALATTVLGLTAVGLLTASRLTGHSKVGPIESSRSLPFDAGAHWNPFYHPDGARHFEVLVRRRVIAAFSIESSDSKPVDEVLSLAVEEQPEGAPESVTQAVAKPVSPTDATVPAMPPRDTSARDQAIRVLPIQDNRPVRSAQTATPHEEGLCEPPQQTPLRAEALAADSLAQAPLTALGEERLTEPAVEAAPDASVNAQPRPAAATPELHPQPAEPALDHHPPTVDTAEVPVASPAGNPGDGNMLPGSARSEPAIETGAVRVAPTSPAADRASGTTEEKSSSPVAPAPSAVTPAPAPPTTAPAPRIESKPVKVRAPAPAKAGPPAKAASKRAKPAPPPPARAAKRAAPRASRAAAVRGAAPPDPYAQQQFTQPLQQYRQYPAQQQFPAQQYAPRPTGRRQTPTDPFRQQF